MKIVIRDPIHYHIKDKVILLVNTNLHTGTALSETTEHVYLYHIYNVCTGKYVIVLQTEAYFEALA